MVEIFTMTFAHSNLIINIILIGAFILNLAFAFTIIFMERRSATEIDVERAKLAKSRAESHLDNDDDNSDINRAKRALERANNRLRVAELK